MKVKFQTIAKGKKPPNQFQYVNCHMVFDIKMENLSRKACLVAGGHMTHIPNSITFSNVVICETVCIALTITVLHDLDVKAVDVLNAYVMAPSRDKIQSLGTTLINLP